MPRQTVNESTDANTFNKAAAPQPAPHLPERDASLPAERQGLFRKFAVGRVDGSDKPGGKHHGCTYFVLDVDHDPCARPALAAYAAACESTHPTLAADLRTKWGVVPAPQPAPVNAWQQAIDHELVTAHLGVAGAATLEEARKALHELICWHIDVATDPATNGGKVLVDAACAPADSDLITIRKPTTQAEVVWLAKLAHLLVSDVNYTLGAMLEPKADSVLEDAARWHWLAEYLVGTRTDLDDEIVASKTVNDLRKLVEAAIKQEGKV